MYFFKRGAVTDMRDQNTKTTTQLLDFIKASPTAFHAVESSADLLKQNGFVQLQEGERWNLEQGKGYFVTRNQSSVIAFRSPTQSPLAL